MKTVMKNFLKALWKALIEGNENTPYEDETYYPKQEDARQNKSWCPFCGYSGTADNLRCHLLNHHKK